MKAMAETVCKYLLPVFNSNKFIAHITKTRTRVFSYYLGTILSNGMAYRASFIRHIFPGDNSKSLFNGEIDRHTK